MANKKEAPSTPPAKTEVDDAVAEMFNELKKTVDAQAKQIADLKSDNEQLKDAANAAEAKIGVLEEELITNQDESAELNDQVAKLSKAAEKITPNLADIDPLKVGKKRYRFAIPAVFFKGRRVTVEDVQDNPELAHELVSVGSGMLREL